MTMTARVSLGEIDQVLQGLPASCLVASASAARLVVGPTGAFVLLAEGTDPMSSALAAGHLAAATRETLADHLSWVPFVDALLVTAADRDQHARATVVSIDLLATTLVEGPAVIDHETCRTLSGLLVVGELAGWNAGLPTGDASIDLCDQPADLSH